MLRIVNRVLLGLAGLVLLAVGGAVLAAGAGLDVPSWWPWHGPDGVLLSTGARRRWRGEDWWWPAVLAALAVLLLAALAWLLVQARRRRLTEVLVNSRDGEGAGLRGRTLEDAMAGEAETLDGVDRARVRLTGRRTAPTARVALTLEPGASPGETLTRLRDGALAHARDSAGLKQLPAKAYLRTAGHRPGRVS
ncbi:alkaline shock response membrane anchor protein AmaP [Streptomyces sp. LP05-1]|uniref:Alkaline shock response membrane anchor protein AmaP n=1 Tax=Streptomyces pyxinae TaxID=2970734 RepID=A0ABT2CIM9_9ACTN|nr:alkaline shock response membrane anchor protein AmaP [Streptomyces sp. LP05-1]MCS0637265.1 alkaline shock response membrane anchor protein AmaP [Streptomyces sp. LP05-1]